MEDKDLMNMLRHAYLFGYNEGYSSNRLINYEAYDPDQRDKDLQELIDDTKKEGGCSYNSFCGSDCLEDCLKDLDL